jgi:hypothetical protein
MPYRAGFHSRRARSTIQALLLFLSSLPAAARAQSSAIVDEGTFVVTRNGTVVGRESFRIARTPGPNGQVLVCTGQSAIGDTRVTSRLATDSAGGPVGYQANISLRGTQTMRLKGVGRPGRFSVLMQTQTGESAKDYLLSNGALLLDDDVFHQFYFVPRLTSHANIIAIDPRGSSQTTYTLADRGSESVTIGRQSVQARHYALVSSSGGTQDVWVDGAGRLLKVALPEKGLVAVRDEAAR